MESRKNILYLPTPAEFTQCREFYHNEERAYIALLNEELLKHLIKTPISSRNTITNIEVSCPTAKVPLTVKMITDRVAILINEYLTNGYIVEGYIKSCVPSVYKPDTVPQINTLCITKFSWPDEEPADNMIPPPIIGPME